MSYPVILFSTGHGKAPKDEADIQQIVNYINLLNPEIFVGDLNFEDSNTIQMFQSVLSNYSIPEIGGVTSENNIKFAGKVSTTKKTRGFNTVQNKKMGKQIESRKDFILWKKNNYSVQTSGAFPELDTLNSLEWPSDHQCIYSMAIEKNTGDKVLSVSLNKPKVWRYDEWLKPQDYENFGKNKKYIPNTSDTVFHEIIKCVYPRMKNSDFKCWLDFIETYNDCNTFGMTKNSFVSEWSKPDDRKWNYYPYPYISTDKEGNTIYHTWSWNEFSKYLKIDPGNPNKYIVKDFKSWSNLWFLNTGNLQPVEGGGTYFVDPDEIENENHEWYSIEDNGINLGMRLFQYYITWFKLYQMNSYPGIELNIENFKTSVNYKRAFIATFGSVNKNKPCPSFSNKFRPEYHEKVIIEKMIEELKEIMLDCDKIFISLQEHWEFNNILKKTIEDNNNYIDIDNRFVINHIQHDDWLQPIDVTVLMFTLRDNSNIKLLESFNFDDEYVLPYLKEEKVNDNGKCTIDTLIKKNLNIRVQIEKKPPNIIYNVFKNYVKPFITILFNL